MTHFQREEEKRKEENPREENHFEKEFKHFSLDRKKTPEAQVKVCTNLVTK